MCPPLAAHSFANLEDVTFSHLDWSFALDFAAQELRGHAEFTFYFHDHVRNARSSPDALATVSLDTHHLKVTGVTVDGHAASYSLSDKHDAVFGRALVVQAPVHATKLRVEYATTAESSGLQWLPKELTAGKTHPYLFTQCQAIHARSIVPCPDTPSAKFTYSATATVPDWCTCLMSAIADPKGKKAHNAVDKTHKVAFRQDVPIPSYLLAIAAGRLESVDLGPRSRVWAEPTVVTKAAHEFAQTEAFLQHAEEITAQPYVWKRYDLVCLPPSFPYGGMENPCLTFVTPTLLAGDRSLADVVAHEIAHSWTGNLVTNRTWKDFWLNEGWTMWLERKIAAKIANDPLAYDLKATMGLRDLVESVEDFGAEHPYTALVPDSDGIDPDETFSSIPYEKGFNFLHYLSTVVGGHEVFETFAQAYIQQFKFRTLTSGDFKAFFIEYFTTTVDKKKAIQVIEWDRWFHAPGMPLVANTFDSTQTSQCMSLARQMAESADASKWTAVGAHVVRKWPATLWILLLDTLLLYQSEHAGFTFAAGHLDAIDAFCHHHLSTTHNAELRFRWFTLALRSRDLRLVANTTSFLKEQGRMKFVRPLFRDLCKTLGPAAATDVFAECRSLYHPIAAKMIQKDIQDATSKAAVGGTSRAGSGSVSNGSVSNGSVSNLLTSWTGVKDEHAGYVAAGLIAAVAVGVAAVVAARRR